MLRVGAAAGLRPWEVYEMTQRELVLFLEGYEEQWLRTREVLAWTQANIMNVMASKGRVKPEKLLPKADVRKRKEQRQHHAEEQAPNLLGRTPSEVAAVMFERRTAMMEAAYESSPDGQRLRALLERLRYGEDDENTDNG